MEPKFMGITSLPRTATQGPLNVPRETILFSWENFYIFFIFTGPPAS